MLGVNIDSAAIKILAAASRFTPRTANRLLKRSRDYSQVKSEGDINAELARTTLDFLEIDGFGLEGVDRRLLEVMIKKFNGGPVGVRAIAAALNEEPGTIEDIYEPFLMGLGFISRTPAGRVALAAAYKHLGLESKNTLI